MKYTAIYLDTWLSGSHVQSLVRMLRMECKDGETVMDMLEREGISDCTQYLFHGHPPIQGEVFVETTEQ